MFKRVTFGLLASALMTGVTAQTSSACNPMKRTGCPDNTALSSDYSYSFSKGEDSSNWSSIGDGDISYTSHGADFIIKKQGNAPTIQSEWYIFYGRVEVHMKAASGTGIVSSAVLLSDDLDEIDWEWLGGENNNVQSNYFSKGNSASTAGESKSVVSDPQGTIHNYTIDWTKDACTWYIDGTSVRTLQYAADKNKYPQTPMRVKLGNWAGGDSSNAEGTIQWAGGVTDFSKVPFTMTVESVKITNYSPGKSYTYSDHSGTGESITINKSDGKSSTTTKKSSSSETTTLETKTGTASATATKSSNADSTSSASADKTGFSSSSSSATSGSSRSSGSGSGSPASTPTGSFASSSQSTPTVASLGLALSPSSVFFTLGAIAAAFIGQL